MGGWMAYRMMSRRFLAPLQGCGFLGALLPGVFGALRLDPGLISVIPAGSGECRIRALGLISVIPVGSRERRISNLREFPG